MTSDLAGRRSALVTALGFVLLDDRAHHHPALRVLHRWLDTWAGIGLVAVGMHRQGFDVSLTQYDERGWRGTFYVSGTEHSPVAAKGTAWEPTPWRAVQRAAWEALRR